MIMQRGIGALNSAAGNGFCRNFELNASRSTSCAGSSPKRSRPGAAPGRLANSFSLRDQMPEVRDQPNPGADL